jgi:hypothetical protein
MGGRRGWKAKVERQPDECGWGRQTFRFVLSPELVDKFTSLTSHVEPAALYALPNLKSERDGFKSQIYTDELLL